MAKLDWTRIIAETKVIAHYHGSNECFRMDCAQTQLESTCPQSH